MLRQQVQWIARFARGDEFGQMARSINALAEQLREKAGTGKR